MKVGLIGAGNMARALARGWGDPVLCSDSGSGRAQALVDELGGEALGNAEVAQRADVVVLCHKPYQLEQVAREVAPHARAVVSVLGGTSIERLRSVYPGVPVFRLMPNTAVEVRRGIVCHTPGETESDLERAIVEMFSRLGTVVAVAERLMPAALAIVGVGPAYQALLAEAQVEAGIRYGLAAPLAGRLVAETMAGAAALLERRGYDTLAVRREVTSPAGSTARGLAALERAGIRAAFQDAIDAVAGWSAE
jgi:pyrroline-5-carboxylate reductase